MKRFTLVILLVFSLLFIGNLYAQENTANTTPPLSTSDREHPFVKNLEAIEIEFIGDMYHWRTKQPLSYQFLQCDASIDRARLTYTKKSGSSTTEYYLVFLRKVEGVWEHDTEDIIFHSNTQKDGTKTTFTHVLKTMSEASLLPSDKELLAK